MQIYRAYEVDDGGYASSTATIIEAKSDVQAIVRAMQFAKGKAMEVWDETRRVGMIERREDAKSSKNLSAVRRW